MIINTIFSIKKTLILVTTLLFLSALSLPASAEDIRYVSDQLSVPVRSGATTGHRIVKFLNSGDTLTVLGTSEDGKFIQVKFSGDKTGWILLDNVMKVPSARARLEVANKKIEKSRQKIKPLKQTIAELSTEIKQLKKANDKLQSKQISLTNSLDDLKITAANPLALSKKNKGLRKDLEKADAKVVMLQQDNQRLSSNVTQEWFLIGAGVSIGSLILGLILTRINWRRKRDSWGDGF